MTGKQRTTDARGAMADHGGPFGRLDRHQDQIRIEPASAGKAYDFIVHVRNIPDIGYNPVAPSDRQRMALKRLRRECQSPRVVEEDAVKTEIWGITSSPPDYVVLVCCG